MQSFPNFIFFLNWLTFVQMIKLCYIIVCIGCIKKDSVKVCLHWRKRQLFHPTIMLCDYAIPTCLSYLGRHDNPFVSCQVRSFKMPSSKAIA